MWPWHPAPETVPSIGRGPLVGRWTDANVAAGRLALMGNESPVSTFNNSTRWLCAKRSEASF